MYEPENSSMCSTLPGKHIKEKKVSKLTSNIQQNNVWLQINYYTNTKN